MLKSYSRIRVRRPLVILIGVCIVALVLISSEPPVAHPEASARSLPAATNEAHTDHREATRRHILTTVRNITAIPRKRIYFLKTHKCASTTVQRVILMYALKHNLSLALPTAGAHNFFPNSYSPENAKRTCAHPHFEVMAAHARFDSSAIGYMPGDTFFLSIVRDPAEQMESVYHYFLVDMCGDPRFQNVSFADHVLSLTEQGTASEEAANLANPCGWTELRFLQLYDLGLNLSTSPNKDVVVKHVDMLDKVFHLVLVDENLDEGLILMRDMLQWTTDDIIYFKNNFRARASEPLSEKIRQAAYAWNWADKMLYDHFKAKMDAEIRRQEQYLREQVRELRKRQASHYDRCIAGVDLSSRAMDTVARVGSYILSDIGKNDFWCQLATMPELALFRHLNYVHPLCTDS